MPLPAPFPGLVLHYAYLWHDEHRRGLEEGIKDRPCVILSVSDAGSGDVDVRLLPITHSPPPDQRHAVEIPLATKHRLGLDDSPSWIVVTELNIFRWPGFDLRTIPRRTPTAYAYGIVHAGLFRSVQSGVLAFAREASLNATTR